MIVEEDYGFDFVVGFEEIFGVFEFGCVVVCFDF